MAGDALHPEILRASLEALDLDRTPHPSHLTYQRFYGLDLGHHLEVQIRLGRVLVGDYQVATQLWLPPLPRATLIVLHGYYDHMGLYRHAVDWGLSMGFAVLACDLPGHGLSSGDPASIREFTEYQQVLEVLLGEAQRLALPQPLHLMGQSTGGAIVLDYLLRQGQHPPPFLGRPMLLAPLVRPCLWGRSRLIYWLLRPFVHHIPRRFTENSSDPEFLRFIQQVDPLQHKVLPVAWVGALDRWIPQIERALPSSIQPLIVQGELDITVDWPYNLQVLREKFRAPEILQLPGARHHLLNEPEATRRQYFSWLRHHLEPASRTGQ